MYIYIYILNYPYKCKLVTNNNFSYYDLSMNLTLMHSLYSYLFNEHLKPTTYMDIFE